MKKSILFFALFATILACKEENEIRYSVTPELAPYVETFYAETAERGVTIPKNLVAELKSAQGITSGQTIEGQNYLYFNPVIFAEHKRLGMENQIEAYVVARMAAIFLHKPAG